jgi:hypothetical protein
VQATSVGDVDKVRPRAVRKFLDFCKLHELTADNEAEFDRCMMSYLCHECYERDAHHMAGSLALNGTVYLLPEITRAIPLAWKSLQAWQKITVSHEGGPIGLETLACMEEWLRARTDMKAHIVADIIPVQTDGYMREQDIFNMRGVDVIFDTNTCIVQFGVASRGESAKTGRDQGIIMDEPYSVAILRRRLVNLSQQAKVFPVSHVDYLKWWRAAATAIGCPGIGPPHSCRHTGASRDIAEHYRDIDGIMRRGRWRATASVQRYAKAHAWHAAVAAQPAEVRKRGEQLLKCRKPRSSKPQG